MVSVCTPLPILLTEAVQSTAQKLVTVNSPLYAYVYPHNPRIRTVRRRTKLSAAVPNRPLQGTRHQDACLTKNQEMYTPRHRPTQTTPTQYITSKQSVSPAQSTV